MEHNLVNGTLIVERDEQTGKAKGIVAHCTCGWSSRPCFTSWVASSLFRDHQEEQVALTGSQP